MFLGQATDIFDKDIIGSFGNFKTVESDELYYVMATLRLDQLNYLTTASQVLDFTAVSFEEMVQRDIDYERVDTEIVEEYLEKGKDRVIFFPPMLVSIMSIVDGKPLSQYDKVVDSEKKIDNVPYFSKIWDENKFELLLPSSEIKTGYEIFSSELNKTLSYYHYAAKIKYNSQMTKLVVIDGQHRFSALERILEKKGNTVPMDVKIPICIFFSPNAKKSTNENMKDHMRDLFVTINNTAKQVGGHFLTLLNDKSLSAMAVRSLANKWKGKNPDYSDCKLHYLEWNQRESKLSNQRTKSFSITTISIISDALSEYVFQKNATTMLNLSEVKSELEEVEENASSQISEDTFLKNQAKIIDKQVEKYITPSLDVLFKSPKPYAELIISFEEALGTLETKITNKIHGASSYKENVLLQFRNTTRYDNDNVKDIEKEFNTSIINTQDNFYFRNVFQMGLIYSWSTLCTSLVANYAIKPVDIAAAFIELLNKTVFNSTPELFSSQREFTQNVIFSAQKIIVNKNSKRQIGNLLLSILRNKKNLEFFVDSIDKPEKNDEIKSIVSDLAVISMKEYSDVFEDNTFKKIRKEWRFMDLSDGIISQLDNLEKKSLSNDKKDIEAFHEQLEYIVLEKKEKAFEVLANLLNIKL